jgi:MFS family permease
MLNASRAVQGVGAAIMFAVSLALLSNAFPNPQERGKAFAAYGASIGAAFAVGPLVGGALTSGLDWRWIFIVNLPLGILCLAITRRYVEESRDSHARKLDWPGQITLTAGLSLLVLALLRGNDDGWTSTAIVAELIGAVAFIGAFIAVEARVKEPMLPLGLFRNRAFTGAQVAAFSISASFFAVFLYTTIYLQQILGLSAIEAGLVYLPATLIMLVVSGATANLVEKLGARTMIAGGLALVAIGQALLTVAAVDSSWTVFLPGEIIALIGVGVFNPAVSAVALGSAPPQMSGLAAGVNDTFRQAGIAVGVAALGALVPAAAAFGGDPQTYVDGMKDALWVGAAVCAAGSVACAVLLAGRRTTTETVPAELALDAA